MKIKAGDSYQDQGIIIKFLDDDYFSSEAVSSNAAGCDVRLEITFAEEEKEDPQLPKRGSDLKHIELIK